MAGYQLDEIVFFSFLHNVMRQHTRINEHMGQRENIFNQRRALCSHISNSTGNITDRPSAFNFHVISVIL